MTTVAYRNGVMAADSAETWGDELRTGAVKVFNTGKYLIGVSGEFGPVAGYLDWIDQIQDDHVHPGTMYKDKEHLLASSDTQLSLLIVNKSNQIWAMTADGFATPRNYEYDTLGSGGGYAMGAMHTGAGAAYAVEAALDYDSGSSGPVIYTSFSHPKSVYGSELTEMKEADRHYTVVG